MHEASTESFARETKTRVEIVQAILRVGVPITSENNNTAEDRMPHAGVSVSEKARMSKSKPCQMIFSTDVVIRSLCLLE